MLYKTFNFDLHEEQKPNLEHCQKQLNAQLQPLPPPPVFSELPNGIIYSNAEWQCQYNISLSLAILNRKYIKKFIYIYIYIPDLDYTFHLKH
jgi:hypothetical protein